MDILALIVCAVIAVVLGFLWYGPFFGRPWRKEMGVSDEQVAAMRNDPAVKRQMMKNALIAAVGALFTAFVLHRAIALGAGIEHLAPLRAGLHFAFWNWLGFGVPVLLGAVLWEGKSWKWWFITIGYYLVSWVLMGLVLAYWPWHAHTPMQAMKSQQMASSTHVMPIASALYTCDNGKTVSAAFFDGGPAVPVAPGQPPVPTGSAEVSLDGAASTTLHQTLSADGARYANSEESFVFWNKGNEALIMRDNSMDLDYKNCTDTAKG